MAGYLDQKMAGLKLSSGEGQAPPKKIGPAVPPKPKKPTQPMVPKSYAVNGPSEPLFTSPLQSTSPEKRPGGPIYSNIDYPPQEARTADAANAYSNAEMFAENSTSYRKAEPQAPVYSNIAVPSHSTATYSNIELTPQTATYSNIDIPQAKASTYSNVPSYANIDEIPPMPEIPDYNDFPPPPADFPPPPSPVSSSYSELRRATLNNNLPDYGTYAPSSQGSTTYDSIYEPITPRPASGMSSRSNYSLYTPSRVNTRSPHEAEVDALTDLLVQSMNSPTADPDSFEGDCCKCGERVLGEVNGCTAMDNVYHIECFTCDHCAVQLQGKPFYVLEGKPYCEAGYLATLEKCSVCLSPILDRILRATGRPYHPQCFCCVVCGKSLDGIPFTVDATNQIHCIEDFHKKFAPRCCVCQQPIMPEPGEEETVRVVALDRSFHISCYKCEDCGLVLSSEAEGRGCYPLDDHILCKSCNAKRVQALTSHMTTEL
ncbi:lipoma preferred partner lpp [Nesidiocoris tenuis]|uniref:Lipoma preferred partner lpp n=1 Tax=Nesidiocoris tenuis TaxID=355587 RepID=A0ABN7A8W2_9HEMI|nr:lipoma preferred partner lpp [Nesidiocoris tenuis]